METNTENELGYLEMGKLLKKMSMPLILSMLVQVLYGLIDSLFVARLGESALVAMSLVMPIQFTIAGVAMGIGVGVNALLSKKLGEKDFESVNKITGNGFIIIGIFSILFILFGIMFVDNFFGFQTNEKDILDMSISYCSILSIFSFASLGQVMMERLLSATGKPDKAMISMISGAVINVILDPILIFGYFGFPELGISGAAIATVIAQFIALIIGFMLNLKLNKEISFQLKYLVPKFKIIQEILVIGIPVALSQCLISFIALGINNILLSLSVVAPAVYVIYIRLQSFVIMPAAGLSSAGISIVAYNYGSRNKDRIVECLKKSLVINIIISILGTLVFLAFPSILLSLFNANDAILEIGIPALRIIGFVFPLTTTALILAGFLQSLGKGNESLIMTIVQTVVLLFTAYALSLTGNVNLVWFAFPMSELIKIILGYIFVKKIYRKNISILK